MMRLLPKHKSVPHTLKMLPFGDEKDNHEMPRYFQRTLRLPRNKKPSSPTTTLNVIRQTATGRSWFFNCLTWSIGCPKHHYVSSTPIHLLHRFTSEETTAGYWPGLNSQDLCFAREEGRCVF